MPAYPRTQRPAEYAATAISRIGVATSSIAGPSHGMPAQQTPTTMLLGTGYRRRATRAPQATSRTTPAASRPSSSRDSSSTTTSTASPRGRRPSRHRTEVSTTLGGYASAGLLGVNPEVD